MDAPPAGFTIAFFCPEVFEKPLQMMNTPEIDNIIRTNGQICPDGTVIELMRNSNQGTVLLRWRDEKFEMAGHVEYSGTTYTAAPIAPSMVRAMRLPARIGPPETVDVLFRDLHSFLTSRSG
jgi:hypothetical protein